MDQAQRGGAPVRSFIAIDLPENVKAALHAVQEKLRNAPGIPGGLARARWVRPEGIHVTLFFLGDVPADQLETVIAAAGVPLTKPRPAFRLRVATIGAFPSLAHPRIVWAGVDGDLKALRDVQAEVAEAVTRLGYRAKEDLFSPHLTLARVREQMHGDERAAVGAALTKLAPEAAAILDALPEYEVRGATFFKSTLGPGGSIYTPLATYTFGEHR